MFRNGLLLQRDTFFVNSENNSREELCNNQIKSGEDDKLQMRKVALKKRRNSQLSELSGAQGMTGLSLLHVNEQPINPQVQSFTEQNLPRPASWNYSTFGEARKLFHLVC